MTSDHDARRDVALGVLRELGRALVVHRLYPDDPGQSSFMEAVERVRNVAAVSLSVGTAAFEIRTGGFHLDGRPLTDGEQVERLARECFDRRVEHLVIRSVPGADDVFHLCRILSLPTEEVERAGGAHVLLSGAGVWAIAVGEMQPDPAVRGAVEASLPPELADLWAQLSDPQRLATNLMVAGLHPNRAQAAQDLFRRFGSLHDELPEDVVGRTAVFRRMREVLDLLPEGIRREFFATVVTKIGAETFATNFANDLTDPDLVTQLLRLGATEGPELTEIATNVIAETGRPATVLPLLAERLRVRSGEVPEDAPTIASIGAGEDGTEVRVTVADALAERLVDEASADLRHLRELYPGMGDDLRVIARLAFRDYLRNETDADRLERSLAGWAATVQQVLRERDRARLEELLAIVELDGATGHERSTVARARRAALSPAIVAELVDPAGDAEAVSSLLQPFGRAALETVMDVLADEEDQARRAQLVGVATGLAREEDVPQLAGWLGDDRWFVVRNIATILGRLGSSDAIPHLVPLLGHPEPAVRREAVRALVASAGTDAVTYLRRAVDDPDASVRRAVIGVLGGLRTDVAARVLAEVARGASDHGDRERALELLGAHPSPAAVGLLRELASRRTKPRLPRALRKLARAAARNAEGPS